MGNAWLRTPHLSNYGREDQTPLIFQCIALDATHGYGQGDSLYAICLKGQMFHHRNEQADGRGCQLTFERLGANDPHAPAFRNVQPIPWFGIDTLGCIRLVSDPKLFLECSHRRFDEDTIVLMWCNNKLRQHDARWLCKFRLNAGDATLSPMQNKHVCLGIKFELTHPTGKGRRGVSSGKVVLVNRSDLQHRFTFKLANNGLSNFPNPAARWTLDKLNRRSEEATSRKRVIEEFADAYLTQPDTFDALARLRERGFAHLRDVVSREILDLAVAEIDQMIARLPDQSSEYLEPFRGRTFPDSEACIAVFNETMLPKICSVILGGDSLKYHQQACQLAMRFPGDHVYRGYRENPTMHFQNHLHGWHIDGFATDTIPGVTDHYGEIRNFDMLVGILLKDVPEIDSGELVVVTGSHTKLAEYMQAPCDASPGLTNLEVCRTHVQNLPNGPRSRAVLGEHPHVHRCIGRAGDVFLANYMTAHFIAPNTSPNTRYAMYFRIKSAVEWPAAVIPGNDFGGPASHCEASMFRPWMHWPGLREAPASDSSYQADEEYARQLQSKMNETGGSGRYVWEE